jgi:hypothetical protein
MTNVADHFGLSCRDVLVKLTVARSGAGTIEGLFPGTRAGLHRAVQFAKQRGGHDEQH